MPNVQYNLIDDDGTLDLATYIFTKLRSSPLNVNTTYTVSLDTTNEWIVLTGSDGNSTHVSYSDFGEPNVLEGVQLDGTDLTITNKKVNIPASTPSGKGVISKNEIDTLIQTALSGFERISFQVVNSYSDLPAVGTNGVYYLIPNSSAAPNSYDEYIWYTNPSTSTSGYEKIGSTNVDLSGYVQYTDISILTSSDISDIVDEAYTTVFGS